MTVGVPCAPSSASASTTTTTMTTTRRMQPTVCRCTRCERAAWQGRHGKPIIHLNTKPERCTWLKLMLFLPLFKLSLRLPRPTLPRLVSRPYYYIHLEEKARIRVSLSIFFFFCFLVTSFSRARSFNVNVETSYKLLSPLYTFP